MAYYTLNHISRKRILPGSTKHTSRIQSSIDGRLSIPVRAISFCPITAYGMSGSPKHTSKIISSIGGRLSITVSAIILK